MKTGLLGMFRLFAEDQLGNPAYALRHDVGKLQKYLEARLPAAEGEKPVQLGGFVYFSHLEVKLDLDQPTVPVVHGKTLKEYLRKLQASTDRLTPARLEQVSAVLEG